jgi:mannose-1-phosphate guanylyltransferase
VYNVHSFKEKPAYEVAQEYVRSGNYLWNSGYFVGSLNTFKNNMSKHAPKLFENYERLAAAKSPKEYEDVYLSFENDTIDYGLIEKVDDLLVVPAAFDWMDLGSFADIHKASENDKVGNSVHGKNVAVIDVENSLVLSTEDKPVAVIGLDNVAVINTPQGVLVIRKDLGQKVKDAVAMLEGK